MKLIELLKDANLDRRPFQLDPVYRRAADFEVGAAFVAYEKVYVVGGCSRLWGAVACITPAGVTRKRVTTVDDTNDAIEEILSSGHSKYTEVFHFPSVVESILSQRRKSDPEFVGTVKFCRSWAGLPLNTNNSSTLYKVSVYRRKNGKIGVLCCVNNTWTRWMDEYGEIARILLDIASSEERKGTLRISYPSGSCSNFVNLSSVELIPSEGHSEEDLVGALSVFSLASGLKGNINGMVFRRLDE